MFWSTLLSFLGLTSCASENYLEKCSDPKNPEKSILFIGNSFTYYGNMPLEFSKLAKERFPNRELKVYFQAGPGLQLAQHSRDKNSRATLMNSGTWDVVVLQDQSEMPLHPQTLKTMTASCRWFDQRIKEFHGKTALLMTWCDLNRPEDQVPISKAYRDIARELHAIVIPAGELFLEVTKKDPTIAIYDPDKHHPSHYGSFLVACLAEDLLLQTRAELEEIVTQRSHQIAHKDPIEQRLQGYADDFALREMAKPQ
ncbi:MAG: hypothetical protein HYX67_07155 [Candidatus Melainabacteria bacterium]|nr:hypothetical protein [Candidatus Melainabacteria bacterium]